jgi:hypothetical protein
MVAITLARICAALIAAVGLVALVPILGLVPKIVSVGHEPQDTDLLKAVAVLPIPVLLLGAAAGLWLLARIAENTDQSRAVQGTEPTSGSNQSCNADAKQSS